MIRLLILRIVLKNLYTWFPGFYPLVVEYNKMIKNKKLHNHWYIRDWNKEITI